MLNKCCRILANLANSYMDLLIDTQAFNLHRLRGLLSHQVGRSVRITKVIEGLQNDIEEIKATYHLAAALSNVSHLLILTTILLIKSLALCPPYPSQLDPDSLPCPGLHNCRSSLRAARQGLPCRLQSTMPFFRTDVNTRLSTCRYIAIKSYRFKKKASVVLHSRSSTRYLVTRRGRSQGGEERLGSMAQEKS